MIAGLYLLLCIEAGTFVDIPGNTLLLLGISSGSYVVSKMAGGPAKPPAAQIVAPVVQPVVVPPAPPVVVTPAPPAQR